MSTDTARTLILVGEILQYIFALIMAFTLILIPLAIVGVVFSIYWGRWRKRPEEHKTGLIVTGIIAIIIGGVVPGILVLIGGVMIPSEEVDSGV